MKPSVGRIVHYIGVPGDPCRAAIITAVPVEEEGPKAYHVCLTIFGAFGPPLLTHAEVPPGDPTEVHGWHWPERVE